MTRRTHEAPPPRAEVAAPQVAEAVQAAQQLALLDSILDAAPVGLNFIDRELRFVRINRRLAEINGVPVEQTVGRTLREVLGDAMADLLEPVYRFVFESGEPVLERELAGSLQGAPQRRAWRVSYYPVKDAGGRVQLVGTVVQDITDALREQERTARLQATTSALSRALTPEDVARVVLTEAVQGVGARRGLAYLYHPVDDTLRALPPVGYVEQVPEGFRVLRADDLNHPGPDALRGGEPLYLESLERLLQLYPRFVPLPANQSSAAWALLPMRVDGRPVGVLQLSFAQERVLSAQDRSFLRVLAQQCALALERARLYREAQGAVALRDELLSVASRALESPLGPLQRELQQLRCEAQDTAPGQTPRTHLLQRLEVVAAQVLRLTTLAQDLLEVSRIGEGRLRLAPEAVDLAHVVHAACAQLAAQAERAGCALRVDAPASLMGAWDRQRVEQVVAHLVSSALQYGAGTPVQVTLRSEGTQAWLRVTHGGSGSAPELLAPSFGKVERAPSERCDGGQGLGLYLAKQLVEAHGGSLDVTSAPDAGATFSVRLPLRPEPASAEP